MASTSSVWLITGVSSGFGLEIAKEAAKGGAAVVGSVRKAEQGEAFVKAVGAGAMYVVMDVNKPAEREAALARVMQAHGRIDVLVNNAGYGFFGAVEEASEQEVRQQMETNFFSALALSQMVLPIMRAQKRGNIVQISSIAGIVSSAGLGIYNASKYALEGFSEAMALEVAPLGIHVTIVEPGPFRTLWAGNSSAQSAKRIDDYAATAHNTATIIQGYSGKQPGDPVKGAALIVRAVTSKQPPLRLPLGQMAVTRMRQKAQMLNESVDACEAESLATAFAA